MNCQFTKKIEKIYYTSFWVVCQSVHDGPLKDCSCETETVTSIFVAHTQVTLIKNCRSQWPGVEHFQSS